MRNARTTLPWALGDVLAQEAVDVRVLAVVDTLADGQDDGSRAWLRATARSEPRLNVIDGPGEGAAAALHLALAQADAPLVSHMEADDRCPPDRLARLAAALTPELDCITSRAGQFGARTPGMRRYLDWQNSLLSGEAMARERFVEIPALHQTGLYRREALDAVGGYATHGPWPLDIEFWLRWFEANRPVAKLPRVLYRWRQHPQQSTRSSGAHDLDSLRAAKLWALERWLGAEGSSGSAPSPASVHLVSTGRTLKAWANALDASTINCVAQDSWKPGQPLPQLANGARFLAVYGTASVRQRFAIQLNPRQRAQLIVAA